MIIKKYLSKIKINNYTLILILLALITGLFKELIIISLLILIHEFGHFIMINKYNLEINKIDIYPFGGVTKIESKIDIPLKEEFLISIMGLIFQELFYLMIILLYKNNYISIITMNI